MFKPGISGNPRGRPKGSCGGRMQALAVLDKLLAGKKTRKALHYALEVEFEKSPINFFKSIVMPLLPRDAKLDSNHDVVIQWQSLLSNPANDPVGVDELKKLPK